MDRSSSGGALGSRLVGVIPFSKEFLGDNLFKDGGELDRDGGLAPWRATRDALSGRGWDMRTIDLVGDVEPAVWLHLDSFGPPPACVDDRRTILVMWEPPVVAPYWYMRAKKQRLPFPIIYTHLREFVERGSPFRYLYWPQPLMAPRTPVPVRSKRLVMINGRKYPATRQDELYSERERVAAWFARRGKIEIYGSGWTASSARHPVASRRTPALRKAYAGRVASKFDVLCESEFVLCFENMRAPGYHTEKLFDALSSGAIPIYLGDPDISAVIDERAFIDYATVGSPRRLDAYLDSLTRQERDEMRAAGQRSLASILFEPYKVERFANRIGEVIEEVTAHA